MPIQRVPGTDLEYHLISYDKKGRERDNDPSGRISELAARVVRDGGVTDVFIASHGWKGDVPAAIEQYDRWIGAMAQCADDRAALAAQRPGFKALLVGFHWPSLPWGDEELGMGGTSFAIGNAAAPGAAAGSLASAVDGLIDDYADRLADTDAARKALRTIVESAMKGGPPTDSLPPDVAAAYATLSREAGIRATGVAGDPGSDREQFDANSAYRNAKDAASNVGSGQPGGSISFAGPGLSGLLSPLRQLSFWKMKDRARDLGEGAGFNLLTTLMKAAPADRKIRFHLMGHSFGCIVVSSMLNGQDGNGVVPRPVDTLTLVQGATSLWGFCNSIPSANKPGYFRKLIDNRKVAGPIITTQSKRDTAVGVFYPVAAGVRLQIAFPVGQFPKYGGLGAFGIQGPGLELHDLAVADAKHSYGFKPGHVYNLECTGVIKDGSGASGAHSDIAKAEVAHAMWEAVKAS